VKYNRVIIIATLFFLLGTNLPAFGQKGEQEKGGGQRAQPVEHQAKPERSQPAQRQAQPQRQERVQHQAQPQREQQAQRQQPQRVQQAQQSRSQQRQTAAYNGDNNGYRGNGNSGNRYGRISNANYSSHFGHEHSFHMGRPELSGGYNRFQYGGYSFGYNQGWPVGWGYADAMYVDYVDGDYYMYDLRHPGIRLTLNIF
jgi:hypothetical protein